MIRTFQKLNRSSQAGLTRSNAGFTLMEILIVMVIIGVLATLGGGSFRSSQIKSRDAKRKSDLKQISSALETYYNDKGQYPVGSAANKMLGCASAAECDWGEQWVDENSTVYMVEIPQDSQAIYNYFYSSSDGSDYQLYARLENDLDMAVPKSGADEPQNYGISCGDANCNYGIASSNTTVTTGRTVVND